MYGLYPRLIVILHFLIRLLIHVRSATQALGKLPFRSATTLIVHCHYKILFLSCIFTSFKSFCIFAQSPEMHTAELDPSIENVVLNGTKHVPHVGIVGAGISGLRCAERLIRQGFKVTIIEARDRIGGRVGLSTSIHISKITILILYQIHQSDKLGYPADM